MFYSELLLIEYSEAELGEGAGKLLQRQKGISLKCGANPPSLYPIAIKSVEEGPQMLTLLFKDLSE